MFLKKLLYLNIATIRYFALTSEYIALTRISDMAKLEKNNYILIDIQNI